ncbi:MAG: aminotransferase class V-fold PLP-dependent enzyme [Oligoflexales bacterium]
MTIEQIQKQFPILSREVNGKSLVYLDSAASALKPKCVADAVSEYYTNGTANVHRGVHHLSERATQLFELGRQKVAKFINAPESHTIFVPSTTFGINMARLALEPMFTAGDELIISQLEHHSNLIPWQMLAKRTGAKIRVIPLKPEGTLDIEAYKALINKRTKLVAVSHVSNAIGTINPVKEIVAIARQAGALTLIDGAQAVCHLRVDVQDLDCDFYVFSGHKLFGPTGVGVLYGRKGVLDDLEPVIGGGSMIASVDYEQSTYADLPYRWEAGTPSISGVIGMGEAISFLEKTGWDFIQKQENTLLQLAWKELSRIEGLTVYGPRSERAPIFSFTLGDVHPHDIGSILDAEGVAVRAGHHCCQPLMKKIGVPATTRASFAFYNREEDVYRLCDAILQVKKVFQ